MATTYAPLATTTLGSAQSTVTFSNISGSYTDLVLICTVKNSANDGDEVGIQFNSDTGSNYNRVRFFNSGGGTASSRSASTDKGAIGINSTSQFDTMIANIQNYSSTNTYKSVLSRGASTSYSSMYYSQWRSTSAITSITLRPDSGTTFASGSTFTIYGILKA